MLTEKNFFAADDPEMQYNLGLRYARGEDVAEDSVEAVSWMRKSAEQGYAAAWFVLGIFYYIGYGVPVDRIAAVKWFRKAAEQGHGDAQQALQELGESW